MPQVSQRQGRMPYTISSPGDLTYELAVNTTVIYQNIKLDMVNFFLPHILHLSHCTPARLACLPFLSICQARWVCSIHSVSLSRIFLHLFTGWVSYFRCLLQSYFFRKEFLGTIYISSSFHPISLIPSAALLALFLYIITTVFLFLLLVSNIKYTQRCHCSPQ